MALINCPECGKEVSDKADMCPNCGYGIIKHFNTAESSNTPPIIQESVNHKYKKIFIRVVILAISLAVTIFCIGLVINNGDTVKINTDKTSMEKSKANIAPYLDTLGKETTDQSYTLSPSAYESRNDVNILGLSGTVSSRYSSESKTQIRIVEWYSNNNISKDTFDEFVSSMNILEDKTAELKSYKTISPETYVWVENGKSRYVCCWYYDNRAYLRWYYDEKYAPVTPAPTLSPTPEPTLDPEFMANSLSEYRSQLSKENYGYVPYDKLARNPNEYKGKSLMYEGKILQTMEDTTSLAKSNLTYLEMRLAVGGNYNNVVYVTYIMGNNDSRFLEDDYVQVYGESKGLYTYESTMGKSITIPSISANLIEKK